MKIKYKTSSNTHKIEKVEIEKESKFCVWIKQKNKWAGECFLEKSMKVSEYQRFHDTWDQAHAFLVEKYKRQIDFSKKKLEHERGILAEVLAMEEF